MVFHTPQKIVNYPVLKINDIVIERVTDFNFLGLVLNAQLNWSSHIRHITTKISRVIGVIYRLKDIYPEAVLLTLYNCLIVSHFTYCLLIWGSKLVSGHSLHLLQKRHYVLLLTAIMLHTVNIYVNHTDYSKFPICFI